MSELDFKDLGVTWISDCWLNNLLNHVPVKSNGTLVKSQYFFDLELIDESGF